jgi:hypothetical protein
MEQTTQLANNPDTISVLELKILLQEIKDRQSELGIRFRKLGEMWQEHFYKIFLVTETGVVLLDQITNRTEIVVNLSDWIQFELDGRFHDFHPYHHYTVKL